MGDENNHPLISLAPSSELNFSLGVEGESTVVLNITNVSSKRVIFKVKTTQPNFYLVRPNQQIVDVGSTEAIVIALTESERKKVLAGVREGKDFDLDSHRFLIQNKILEDERFGSLNDIPAANRSEEFSRLWSAAKDERPNLKLRVKYTYPDFDKPKSSSATRGATVSANVEALRSRLARPQSLPDGDAGASDPDTVFSELLSLKEKYDTIVEYTVHLTAERDSIVTQFEDLQREYAREVSQRKSSGDKSGGSTTSNGGIKTEKSATDKRNIQQGFSVLAMVIAVFISLIIGRYVKM